MSNHPGGMRDKLLRGSKQAILLGLCLSILSVSGCVYLRLLKLKSQLSQFDKYFQVVVTDSFTLQFNKPVLYQEDLLKLTQLQPSEKTGQGTNEAWTYRFKKMVSETEEAPGSDRDICFTMAFNEKEKLQSLTFSSILLQFAPPEFLELSLRSLGNAKVDKKKRQVKGNTDHLAKLDQPLPQRPDIVHHLGKPFSDEIVNKVRLITYHYRLKTTSVSPALEKKRLSVTRLYFDPQTDELLRAYGRFAGMKISIDYTRLIQQPQAISD